MEGIRVGVLTSVRLFVWAAFVFFRFLSRPSVTLPVFSMSSVLLNVTVFKDTFYVMQHRASSYGGGV